MNISRGSACSILGSQSDSVTFLVTRSVTSKSNAGDFSCEKSVTFKQCSNLNDRLGFFQTFQAVIDDVYADFTLHKQLTAEPYILLLGIDGRIPSDAEQQLLKTLLTNLKSILDEEDQSVKRRVLGAINKCIEILENSRIEYGRYAPYGSGNIKLYKREQESDNLDEFLMPENVYRFLQECETGLVADDKTSLDQLKKYAHFLGCQFAKVTMERKIRNDIYREVHHLGMSESVTKHFPLQHFKDYNIATWHPDIRAAWIEGYQSLMHIKGHFAVKFPTDPDAPIYTSVLEKHQKNQLDVVSGVLSANDLPPSRNQPFRPYLNWLKQLRCMCSEDLMLEHFYDPSQVQFNSFTPAFG